MLDTILRGQAEPVVTLVAAGAVAVLYQPLRLRLPYIAVHLTGADPAQPRRRNRRPARQSFTELAPVETMTTARLFGSGLPPIA